MTDQATSNKDDDACDCPQCTDEARTPTTDEAQFAEIVQKSSLEFAKWLLASAIVLVPEQDKWPVAIGGEETIRYKGRTFRVKLGVILTETTFDEVKGSA